MQDTKQFIEETKQTIARLRLAHGTAATPGCKRTITAYIKRYERSLANLEKYHNN